MRERYSIVDENCTAMPRRKFSPVLVQAPLFIIVIIEHPRTVCDVLFHYDASMETEEYEARVSLRTDCASRVTQEIDYEDAEIKVTDHITISLFFVSRSPIRSA